MVLFDMQKASIGAEANADLQSTGYFGVTFETIQRIRHVQE